MANVDKQPAEDDWQNRSMTVVRDFGSALKDLEQANPWPDRPVLPQAIDHLMTELWDHGFSQTEIRQAFVDAIEDMPRYANGFERRP